ncbi:MAG: 30S ribosomal protein S12 methylthiotransferase RimO [Anaerolineae bacterium]|nr:30S ribosomal protein S12 methylthiotransferase RimO [Anaerolineae bacterium]
MRYYMITLGCPKNAVDAEGMGTLLDNAGHVPVFEPERADVLLVNTCGFIESARAESIAVLRGLAAQKRPDQRLLAVGCYAQRAGVELARHVPGLDGILGTRRWAEIVSVIEQIDRRQAGGAPVTVIGDPDEMLEPGARTAVQGKSAYLKIADGCSASCAYCAIPLIKGPLRSRPAPAILRDARDLARRGIQEIILIAQDTTAYGQDRGERDALANLLSSMVDAVPDVPWIRLMYAYPQHITPRLIATMARHEQICHYLDLPLQHAHPDTLRRMGRPDNVRRVRELIDNLRAAMPDIALRTTFIVGYPGETEREFHALEEFVDAVQFDKVGAFTFSPEGGTRAYDLPDRVPDQVQDERYNRLMARQQAISLARNEAQVGRILDVLVEGVGEVEYEDAAPGETTPISLGRSYRDAPEIDGLVLIEDTVEPGQIVPVEVSGAMEYDLVGTLA